MGEAALAAPDSLADMIMDADGDCQSEAFLYAPSKAWEAKTGGGPGEMPRTEMQLGEPTGEPWDEDSEEPAARYPKLSARFSE